MEMKYAQNHQGSFPDLEDVAVEEAAKSCKLGMKPEDVQHHYNLWSQDGKYDEHLSGDYYKGPTVTAATVLKYTEKKDVGILDVAAGTGLVGERLRELGFTQVDALDPSEGMLLGARRKDIYRTYSNKFFTRSLHICPKSDYDVLVCCGGMMGGHLECDSLREMVYCVKKGGLIVIVMREEYLLTVPEYQNRLEPYMEQIENEGQWVRLERTVIPGYFYKYNGLCFVFRVTKTD